VALLGSGLALALALVRHLQQLLMGQKAPHTVSHSAEVAGGAALLLAVLHCWERTGVPYFIESLPACKETRLRVPACYSSSPAAHP
jgi:hypothetical protein